MCPEEWWRLYEIKRKRDPATDYAGKLTEAECAELYALLSEEG